MLTAGWRKENGLYREPHLAAAGIPHGVTSRGLGNMKEAPRRREALAAAGLADRTALTLAQEHGAVVLEARAARAEVGLRSAPGAAEGPGTAPAEAGPGADGWVCADRGAVPCVFAADCLPIFIWDRRRSAVGVFHAGWRGLSEGMPRAAVRAFRRYGLTPESLLAAVGPHVGACCYQVGPEVAARFRPEVRVRSGGGAKLDLGGEARAQLLESGLGPERVSVSAECTACLTGEFYSFRREKADLRMMAFIALP